MNKTISPKIIALAFGVLTITFLAAFYAIAWQDPALSPPDDNVDKPINVGTDPQAKAGRISATELYDFNDPDYYINPSGSSNIDTLCFGSDDCQSGWPAAGGGGTVVTYHMTNDQAYNVGDSYYGATVSYNCPEGSNAVITDCKEVAGSGQCCADYDFCSCSTSDRTASLTQLVGKLAGNACEAGLHCGSAVTGCTNTGGEPWFWVSCSLPPASCEMEFQCGTKIEVNCSADGDCASGNCVDGYCCDSACDTPCYDCNVPGLEGTCTALTDLVEDAGCDTACRGCSAGSCVDIPDDNQDTVGPTLCNQTCKKCSGGSCDDQTISEDLFSQCPIADCFTGNCNGAGACATTPQVYLNSATAKSCDTICSEKQGCNSCAAVGVGVGATGWNQWAIDWVGEEEEEPEAVCVLIGSNCGSAMYWDEAGSCGGQTAAWSYCKCQ